MTAFGRLFVGSAVICLILVEPSKCGYSSGQLFTLENWAFLSRFCFLSDNGVLQYSFTFPVQYQPQKLLFYYDEPDQWPAVYKVPGLSCQDKISPPHILPENNQAINLDISEPWSGCSLQKDNVTLLTVVQCSASRSFKASRARWWYLAMSRCQNSTIPGMLVNYQMSMTNGDGIFQKQFSADEMHILETDIAFLVLTATLLVLAIVASDFLHKRQLFHTSYKIYLASLACDCLYLLIMTIVYGKYANDGLSNYGSKTLGGVFEAISILIFVCMLLLMGKGFTITRGRISTSGSIKIAVFMTLYTLAYAVLFFYNAQYSDPGEVLYIYESPPGYGILVCRIIAWIYFSYACFFTLKHYPEKSKFYYPFYCFYTIWFIIGPIFVLVAYFAWPKYQRAKIVNGVDQSITFLAQIFFLFLTRPTNANKNFPFHVRTSQIGILRSEAVESDNREMNNFDHHAYAPSTNFLVSGPNFTALFNIAKNVYETDADRGNTPRPLTAASNGSFKPRLDSSKAITREKSGTIDKFVHEDGDGVVH